MKTKREIHDGESKHLKRFAITAIAAEHSSFAAPPEFLPRNRFADNLARK